MDRIALFFSFRGRVGRQEYWLTVIGNGVVLFAAGTVVATVGGFGLLVAVPLCGLVIWAALAMLVRRLHDRGRSGWWLLPMVVPVFVLNFLGEAASVSDEEAGLFFKALTLPFSLWSFIDLGCLPGRPEPNRFGPPLARPAAAAEVFD